jgi:hypothetical protein
MLASLAAQRVAVSAALRRSPGVAILLTLAKLTSVLVLFYLALGTDLLRGWLAPLSFAAGVTSLPLAIVLDVCYREWSSRRRSRPPV